MYRVGVAGHGTPVILAGPAWYDTALDGTAAVGGLGLLSVDGLAVLLDASRVRVDPAVEPRWRMNGVVTIAARIVTHYTIAPINKVAQSPAMRPTFDGLGFGLEASAAVVNIAVSRCIAVAVWRSW